MRVSKWGRGLAVTLPKAAVNELGLKAGNHLEIASAPPKRLTSAGNERGCRAIERMSSRPLTVPAGYAFDQDKTNAR